MSRLITSDNALRALLLLSQHAGGVRTSEVADALEISYTGAKKALDILVEDGLAGLLEYRHTLAASPRAHEAVRFALAFLPADVTLAALARGNEAVEFAGVDEQGALVVFRRFSEPAAEGRMRDAVATLRQLAPGTLVDLVRKEDVREQLLGDIAPRRRAAGMRILAGTIERTFPDRTRHGDVEARPLGRLNEAIAVPSGRRLRGLAGEYGLRRILAFGSATRADFRPDSDIDLLVEPVPGHHLGLDERVSLMADVERLFDRDVDLLTAPVRRVSLAHRISRDGVVLYDAAR
jgi:predicted nucleotidyltransferase